MDARKATVVTYHYVRDLKESFYPEIKGLETKAFKEQLEYLSNNFNIISMENLIDAVKQKQVLPPNSLLLTFDDGFKDHYDTVFPILNELGIHGTFFIPTKAVSESVVLDVHKIHFILAAVWDKAQLVEEIEGFCNSKFELDAYRSKIALEKLRFDTREVVFIKRMLQRDLPMELRTRVLNYLFSTHVSRNERAFAHELYMSVDQIKCMERNGMFIGNHGYDHVWLNSLSRVQQEAEIKRSVEFFESIGCNTEEFVFCHPYGACNSDTLSLLRVYGFELAFTTEVGRIDLNRYNQHCLPRLDTNDI